MSEKPGFTLANLRAFHEGKAYRLAQDKERRGAWPGEDVEREAFEATVRLIDRIAAAPTILAQLRQRD